jgi:hypothetical protein
MTEATMAAIPGLPASPRRTARRLMCWGRGAVRHGAHRSRRRHAPTSGNDDAGGCRATGIRPFARVGRAGAMC